MSEKGAIPDHPVLIVDDEPPWIRSFSMTLRMNGVENILTTTQGAQALEIMAQQPVSVVVIDLIMPEMTGEDLLKEISENHPQAPVIVMTGIDDIRKAVRCVKLGAFDYFVKTEDSERLIAGVKRAIRFREISEENIRLRDETLREATAETGAFQHIVTQSEKMKAVFKYLEAVATSSQPILVTGESGVGKELIAQSIHQASGRPGKFVAVNVAGLDDNMFSDALFGHLKGAYTGAQSDRKGLIAAADGGTLFLDEIGDLEPRSQVKLLRMLQEGEYYPLGSDNPEIANVKIVAATHQNLKRMIGEKTFRNDLYYRLSIHQVKIPPLRERYEDLPILLEHFIQSISEEQKKSVAGYPPSLLTLMKHYPFPGNIRELRSIVFDAVSSHSGGKLSLRRFKEYVRDAGEDVHDLHANQPAEQSITDDQESGSNHKMRFGKRLPTLKEASKILIQEALDRAEGNQALAAEWLGVSRQALNQRLKRG